MGTDITSSFALGFGRDLLGRTAKIIVVIGVVSSVAVAGFAIAATGAGVALGAQPDVVSVNHIRKGDRLSPVPKSTATPPVVTTLSHPPVGCESAFSRVVDPARAHIFGRCIS
jgi:hypothetical protein